MMAIGFGIVQLQPARLTAAREIGRDDDEQLFLFARRKMHTAGLSPPVRQPGRSEKSADRREENQQRKPLRDMSGVRHPGAKIEGGVPRMRLRESRKKQGGGEKFGQFHVQGIGFRSA